jgi:hypothetical protein
MASSSSKNKRKLGLSPDDLGKSDSLRHSVLQSVSRESYERAIDTIKMYVGSQPEFPEFKVRAIRYLEYGIDLVNGIKAKKSFPGLSTLPMNKQEELFSRAYEHFEDLKLTLKKIEKIEREVRLEDKRSTIWIIRAIVHSTAAIVVLGIFLELTNGTVLSVGLVVNDALNRASEVFLRLIGF